MNEATDWRSAAATVLVLGLVVFRAAPTVADPDLWGHLRFGHDMISTGRLVPAEDPYSYLTAGHPWTDNEWLAELVVTSLARLTGAAGLIGLKLAIAVLLFGTLMNRLSRAGLDGFRAALIVLPAVFLSLPAFTTVRMHLFTNLGLLVWLLVLDALDRGQARWLFAVPPLFAVWVNLHGGVLAGLGVLGVWAVTHLALTTLGRGTLPPRVPVLAVAGAVVGVMVTPYGAGLIRHDLIHGTGARPDIGEFAPIRVASLEGAVYLGLVGLTAAGWALSRLPRSLPLLAVVAVTVLTPLLATRHASLFATAAVLLSAPHLADAAARWLPASRIDGRIAALTGGMGLALFGLAAPHAGRIVVAPEAGQPFPVRAVERMAEAVVSANAIVFFDWGEYVIWRAGPRVRVSVDGRRDSAFPNDVYAANVRFLNGVNDWEELLHRGDPDLALMPRGSAAFNLLRLTPGWEMIHQDELCGLFGRKGSAAAEAVARTPPRTELPADGAGIVLRTVADLGVAD